MAAALLRGGCSSALFEDIIVNGTVRFLPAYPAVRDRRSLPVPLTWQRDKDASKPDDNKADSADALLALFGKDDAVRQGSDQRQPVQHRFYAFTDPAYETVKIKKSYRTHQVRDRATGITNRRGQGDDTVFVYESLDAGQTFVGAVAVPADRTDLHTLLKAVFAEEIWLGRSARSGYGGTPSIIVDPAETMEPGGAFLDKLDENTRFRVRLTSDTLLRHSKTGQYDPAALADALKERFKDYAELQSSDDAIPAVCIQQGRVTGYHRLWRTHLGEFPCAAAGSVALFQAKQVLSADKLAELQAEPLGERIAEGCGCFVIEPLDKSLTLNPEDKTRKEIAMPPLPAPPLMVEAQRRLYRQEIALLIAAQAQTDAAKVSRLPSVSLIQRMRVPLRNPNWREQYRQWLPVNSNSQERNALKKAARDPLSKARIGGKSLLEFLREAADPKQFPPLASNAAGVQQRLSFLDTATAQEIWNEEVHNAWVAYLDTLLGHLAKLKRRSAKGEEGR